MGLWRLVKRAAPAHAHFLGTWSHAFWAAATLGVPLAVGTIPLIFGGLALYGLGLIFLPDLPPFRRSLEAKRAAAESAAQSAEKATVAEARAHFEAKLSDAEKSRWLRFQSNYSELRADFEQRGMDEERDLLERLSHNFLLLLAAKVDVERYNRSRPDAAALVSKRQRIERDIESLNTKPSVSESEQRLLNSWREQLDALDRQTEQNRQIEVSYRLTLSELDRLELELANLKASLIAQPSAQLADRIGATLQEVMASQRVIRDVGISSPSRMEALLRE